MSVVHAPLSEDDPHWYAGVVKIFGTDGGVRGAGMLVTCDLIATCAHVVKDAGCEPGESLQVAFVLCPARFYTVTVQADLWNEEGDVAFLLLDSSATIPRGVAPFLLGTSTRLDGRTLHGYGFPQGEKDGHAAKAEVIDRLPKEPRLQLRSTELTEGYSGGPLFDKEHGVVVGMTVSVRPADRFGRGEETAYGNTTEILKEVCPQLRISSSPVPPLLQGMQLRGGISERLRNWLDDMIGEAVIFAGRDAALEELNRWLDDSDAPSSLLLWGAGGCGKSSLLARWAADLHNSKRRLIVLLPITSQHGLTTAKDLLPALAGRLFRLYHRTAPDLRDAEHWSDAVSNLLREPPPAPLLVIVDGIDEAASELLPLLPLPTHPAPNVRVVVSVRCDDEKRRLGWLRELKWDSQDPAKSMQLQPLKEEEVCAVIKAGWPNLTEQEAKSLSTLSQGNPLALAGYLADVKEGTSISELARVGPGLIKRFERWRAEQTRLAPSCLSLVALLAIAREPISAEDLAAISGDSSEDSVNAIRGQLTSLHRFVRHYPTGEYGLSNPLYKEFLVQHLEPNLNGAVDLYHKWIARTIQTPSDYAVKHAQEHLEESGDQKGLADLCLEPWRRAWSKIDQTETGFLADAKRASHAAAALDRALAEGAQTLEWLGHEIRFPLYNAVRVNRLQPAWLVGTLIAEGGMNPFHAIRLFAVEPDQSLRALQLANLAGFLPKDAVPELLDECQTFQAPEHKALVLAAIAGRGGKESAPLAEEAISLIRRGSDGQACADSVGRLAPCLDQAGLASLLTWLAETFGVVPLATLLSEKPEMQTLLCESDWQRLKSRAAEVFRLSGINLSAKMFEVLWDEEQTHPAPMPESWQESIEDKELSPERRAGFLAMAEKEIDGTADSEQCSRLWVKAASLLSASDSLRWQQALAAFAPLSATELLDLADRKPSAPVAFWDLLASKVAELDEYSDWVRLVSQLLLLVPDLPEVHHRRGFLEKALDLLQLTKGCYVRPTSYQLLKAFRAAYGESWPHRAIDKANAIEFRDRRLAAEMLFGIAEESPRHRRECLKLAVKAAAEVAHFALLAKALASLARCAGDDGHRLALIAIDTARREPIAAARIEALGCALAVLPVGDEPETLDELLEVLPKLPLTNVTARAWDNLPALTPVTRLSELIQAADALNPFHRCRVVGNAASRMSEEAATDAVRLVLHQVETTADPRDIHARAVAPVARWCDQNIISEAIREAQKREGGSSRGFVMAELLPYLHNENRRRQLLEEELAHASVLKRDKASVIVRLALIAALPDRRRWILKAIDAAVSDDHGADARAWALADLLLVLPANQREDVAYPALDLLESPESGVTLSAAAGLVGELAAAKRPQFLPRFHRILTSILAGLPDRIPEVLETVGTLSPMIEALGGAKGASAVAAAIQDARPQAASDM
jgi:hypothetical protein